MGNFLQWKELCILDLTFETHSIIVVSIKRTTNEQSTISHVLSVLTL